MSFQPSHAQLDLALTQREKMSYVVLSNTMREEAKHIFKAFVYIHGWPQKEVRQGYREIRRALCTKRNIIHERACFYWRFQKERELWKLSLEISISWQSIVNSEH